MREPPVDTTPRTESVAAAARGLIERDDSVLFIIDVQPGFLAKLEQAEQERVVDTIRFLAEVARRLAIPSILTAEEPRRNGPTVAAVRAALDPATPELDKRVFGLADQPDLAAAVLAQTRRTAVLVGLETDVCVLHSAVGLAQCGFRCAIVTDATAAPPPDHDWGLKRAVALGIELVRARGLYYEWARSIETCAQLASGAPIRRPPGLVL